jgi:hypothetical protein
MPIECLKYGGEVLALHAPADPGRAFGAEVADLNTVSTEDGYGVLVIRIFGIEAQLDRITGVT